MTEENTSLLQEIVKNDLDKVKERVGSLSEELRVLHAIKKDDIDFPNFIAISEVPEALTLRASSQSQPRFEYIQEQSHTPKSVADFNFEYISEDMFSPNIVERQVYERIDVLESRGVEPAPLPEVNYQSMQGFLSNMTNYISKIIAIPTVEEIMYARKNPKSTRMLVDIFNNNADRAFFVVLKSENIEEIPVNVLKAMQLETSAFFANDTANKLGMNLNSPISMAAKAVRKNTGVLGAGITSVATYLGEQLGLSKDEAANLGNIIIGTIKSGDVSRGFANASKTIIRKELWKRLGGKKNLKDFEFYEAGDTFNISSRLSSATMDYFSAAIDTVAAVVRDTVSGASPDIGGVFLGSMAEQAVKIGAQGLLLGTIVSLKNYFAQNPEPQSHNPELVAKTVDSLSIEEERIKREVPELSAPINEFISEIGEIDHITEKQEKKWTDLSEIKNKSVKAAKKSIPSIAKSMEKIRYKRSMSSTRILRDKSKDTSVER